MLSTWLYTSACTLDGVRAAEAVDSIVSISRPRNNGLGVTGSLIWTGRRFAQFLEGPAAGISALRASISGDGRHRDIVTLEATRSRERVFRGWSLAYSGTASFVERELARICDRASAHAAESARDLKQMLLEFERSR